MAFRGYGLRDPQILYTHLPKDEQLQGHLLGRALSELKQILQSFDVALQLFDTCMEQINDARKELNAAQATNDRTIIDAAYTVYWPRRRLLSSWAEIAVRDGAMQIWKLGTVIESIRSNIFRVPSLRASIDGKALRGAFKEFRAYFPSYEAIRHAVAHPHAELMGTPEKLEREALGSGRNVIGGIDGRSFYVTKDKAIHRYELSDQSIQRMITIVAKVYDCFRDAEAASAKMPYVP